MANITIGAYYPAKSKIHSLDPRTKILGVIFLVVVLFMLENFYSYFFMGVLVYALIKISKVPPKMLLKGLRGILFIALFTTVLNVLFTQGETVLLSFGVINITLEGIFVAIKTVARLTMLIMISSIMTLTTAPIALTDGIESLLKPFKKIGVPAHEIAMMMTIALRFIPTLMEELEKIMKAQMSRGAEFDTGGILQKAKSLIPVLVPLFISSFRRSDELAMAMEARCYRGDIGRTRMKVLTYGKNDMLAWIIMLSVFVCVFLINLI